MSKELEQRTKEKLELADKIANLIRGFEQRWELVFDGLNTERMTELGYPSQKVVTVVTGIEFRIR